MAYSSKLCNPTPFPVKLNWNKGVNIKIGAFGAAELTMQQMDDFRPGKAGSADVKSVLDYYGLFLLDSDRPYDNQALEALRRAHDAKKAQYDAAVRNITDRRAAAGVAPNEDALEETLRQMGLVELRRKIEVLQEAVQRFRKVVGDKPEQSLRRQLDPKRTVFVLEPPEEFPSVAAMEFFLDQNPEVKAKHQAWKEESTKTIVGGTNEYVPRESSSEATSEAAVQNFIAETQQAGA